MSLFKKALNATPAYQAVKLGTKAIQQHSNQQQATNIEQTQPVEAAKPKIKKVSFGYSHYLGGHSTLGKKRQGNLVLNEEAIGIGTLSPKHAALKWTDIADVEVGGGQVAKSKVGATIAFGVLGGLAASGSKNQATITVHTKDNQTAYYLIDKVSSIEAKAKITPVLHTVGVPLTDENTQTQKLQQSVQSNDVTDQLTKLAKLKEQGILTDEEFTAKKKQLLGL